MWLISVTMPQVGVRPTALRRPCHRCVHVFAKTTLPARLMRMGVAQSHHMEASWIIRSAVMATGLLAGGAVAGTCARVDAMRAYEVSGVSPPAAICQRYLGEAGRAGASCHWGFPYRDAAAQAAAAEIWAEIQACLAGHSAERDAGVNHPDSYDLRIWQSDDETFAVAVKDKAALNRTLVFLRWERGADQ